MKAKRILMDDSIERSESSEMVYQIAKLIGNDKKLLLAIDEALDFIGDVCIGFRCDTSDCAENRCPVCNAKHVLKGAVPEPVIPEPEDDPLPGSITLT